MVSAYLFIPDRSRCSILGLGRSLFIITYLTRWRGKHVVSRRCSHMWVNTRSKRLGVRSSGYKRWKRGMAEGGELLVSIIRHASNEWFVFEWKLRRDIRYLHRCPCKWYSDGHLPTSTTLYRAIRIFFSDFPWRNSFLIFSPFFSLLFLFTLDLSRQEIAFDLSRYVEKLFSTIVIYFTTNDIRNVCWICLSDFDLWKLKIVNSYIITRNKIKIVQRLIFILSLIFLQPRSFLLSEFYSLENEV